MGLSWGGRGYPTPRSFTLSSVFCLVPIAASVGFNETLVTVKF